MSKRKLGPGRYKFYNFNVTKSYDGWQITKGFNTLVTTADTLAEAKDLVEMFEGDRISELKLKQREGLC